ncbi:MAG: hypothetical protein JWN67_1717 [Actinomycetia bacterium]|nr:hypothetical protein [Actinomycetes bacterium]
MVARTAVRLLVVAGTLVPATVASGGAAWAQLPTTTTTVTLPTSSTTTTAAPGSTTTTVAPDPTTTTTTTDPGGTSTSTTTTAPGGTATPTGGLSISVPAAADLSAGTPVNAGAVTAQLGPVTVTDGRTGLVAGWTASVTGSDFTTGGASPAETIPAANVAYWSGPATASSGTAMFVPGQPDAQHAQSLGGACTAFSAVTSSGGTSATWNPGLVVTLPPTAVTGQYHGTITHSVA